MRINRRSFIASLSLLPATLAYAAEQLPANRNIKWAVSSALWNYFPPLPFTSILDVMKEAGFPGIRLANFPGILNKYGLTAAQMLEEVSKRNLNVVTISWNFPPGPLQEPTARQQAPGSARQAVEVFLGLGGEPFLV